MWDSPPSPYLLEATWRAKLAEKGQKPLGCHLETETMQDGETTSETILEPGMWAHRYHAGRSHCYRPFRSAPPGDTLGASDRCNGI